MDYIDFEWERCIDGYRLTEDRTDVLSVSNRAEKYRPTAFPTLFRVFADQPATAEGALDFIGKFGLLGHYTVKNYKAGGVIISKEGLTAADTEDGRFEKYINEPVAYFIEAQRSIKDAICLFENKDLVGLVKAFNRDFTAGQLRPRLRDRPFGRVALVFRPITLLQFMWLQFGMFTGSGNRLLRCERCNAPFIVGAGTGRRETAKFCSNACKVAAFRARNESKTNRA